MARRLSLREASRHRKSGPRPTRRLRLELLEDRDLLAVDLVSVSLTGGSGNAPSGLSQVSDNGRYVVFESQATNLTNNQKLFLITDIYRRDMLTGVTQLVSVSTTNTSGNNPSSNPVISADGRFVAFSSQASNLVNNDTNLVIQDVFVRDMQLGVTQLVSVSIFNLSGNQASASPSISDNGQFVAFTSQASDLVANDFNFAAQDVFVRDRVNNTTTLISVNAAGNSSGNLASGNPAINGNGTVVAFDSQATDLIANDTNGGMSDVFVRPVAAGPTVLVSINRTNNGSGNLASTVPTISIDGQIIAFQSLATDLTFNDNNPFQDVFVRNRTNNTTVLASATPNNLQSGNLASGSAILARGGGHVAFVSASNNLAANDVNGVNDVFVRTLATNSTVLASRALNGFSGNQPSTAPALNADGRYVAFVSQASDLVGNDTNVLVSDIFRRDLQLNLTALVSFNLSASASGMGNSIAPSISDDGQAISFSSQAADLVVNDTNGMNQDIFYFATSTQIVVTGADAGGSPHVRVLDARNGGLEMQFFPYSFVFTGGVRVASGDVNMDGVPDIVTAPGPGGSPHVRVFSGVDGSQLPGLIGSFFAYAPAFTGGVFVATADINLDGRADIITGADAGGGPHVRVFSGLTGAPLTDIFPYAFAFTGGVRVAGGDVNGDLTPDIITAPGAGGGPHVRVFSGTNSALISEYFAYAGQFFNGVYVATGDTNGDGRADLITGPDRGGGPHLRVVSGLNGADLLNVFAFDPAFTGGVRVASADVNGDGRIDAIAVPGPGIQARVRAFSGITGGLIADAIAYPGFPAGIFVSGSKPSPGGSPAPPFVPQGAANLSSASMKFPALGDSDVPWNDGDSETDRCERGEKSRHVWAWDNEGEWGSCHSLDVEDWHSRNLWLAGKLVELALGGDWDASPDCMGR